ncbi:MAG: hypothetical protein AAF430_02280 [Myxococcota bacterium]
MAESAAFDHASHCLEAETEFDRLAARGTVRLLLKKAGLEPRTVSPREMAVAVEKLLADELRARGVANPDVLCQRLAGELAGLRDAETPEGPEAVFARLGGRSAG